MTKLATKSWSSIIYCLGVFTFALMVWSTTEENIVSAEESGEPCPKPYIEILNPKAGKPGQEIEIRGNRLGHEQGSVVFSPGVKAEIIKWEYQRVRVRVPDNAETGLVYVSASCGENSNEEYFTVKRPE